MASGGVDHISDHDAIEGSGPTIEIKIKTLNSQTYTLRVDKQMPVPALKEQIASVTGVLSEQQRLICCGKVLKDDQLLSAYHVEDGHTLHMVVRQPIPPSSEALSNYSATDPASTSRGVGHSHQVAPGVVIETFSLPVQGDGAPPEISRIVSAVLGSTGFSNFGSSNEGIDNRENSSQRPERTPNVRSTLDSTIHLQSEQSGMRAPSDRPHGASGHSAAFSLGPVPPHVIPDSLTTLVRYLSNMRREFDAISRDGGNNNGQAGASQGSEERSSQSAAGTRQGFPTPASLAEVVLSARQLLTEQAAETLFQLVRQLENQVNVTDSSTRTSIQASAMRIGALFHNLGSFLLELGRTIMTLRLGQSPSEAVVNAGPAVFISPTGPNPIMVQPLPFQVGSSFGSIPMGSVHPGSGLVNGLGTGFLPRRIDIQIRRAAANANNEEHANNQQPTGQRNSATSSGGENPANQGTQQASDGPAFAGESGGVRVVPLRTMVAAVPGPFSRLPSDSSGNSVGLYYPVLGRFQHVASGHVSAERGTQASDERQSAHQSEDSAAQQQPPGDPARDGSLPTPSLRQHETVNARSVNINIVSAGGMQNNVESDRQIPTSVMQFIRSLLPGGEIHVEYGSSEGRAAAGSHSDQARTSASAAGGFEAEPRASEEGIIFSNLLHQIMPLISRQVGSESDTTPQEQANASEAENNNAGTSDQAESSNAGTSRRQGDCESGSPSSKRQKVE